MVILNFAAAAQLSYLLSFFILRRTSASVAAPSVVPRGTLQVMLWLFPSSEAVRVSALTLRPLIMTVMAFTSSPKLVPVIVISVPAPPSAGVKPVMAAFSGSGVGVGSVLPPSSGFSVPGSLGSSFEQLTAGIAASEQSTKSFRRFLFITVWFNLFFVREKHTAQICEKTSARSGEHAESHIRKSSRMWLHNIFN